MPPSVVGSDAEVPRRPLWVLRLDAPVAECHGCGAEGPSRWGIPIWEGFVLPNDWQGEWAGVDACEACWTRQGQLTAPVALWAFRKRIHDERQHHARQCHLLSRSLSSPGDDMLLLGLSVVALGCLGMLGMSLVLLLLSCC